MGELFATKSELRQGQVKVPLNTRTKIVVVPDALECEIVGKLFDRGKTFLWVDRAVEGLRFAHRFAVRAAADKDVLIVVHTDPQRDTSQSEELSKERAAMVAAWFEGDVDPWLDNYKDSVPKQQRWGAREDHRMLGALGDVVAVIDKERPQNADPRYDALVCGFQRSRKLTDDGIAGPVTRKQLIQEYFALAKVTDELAPVPLRGEAAKASVKLAEHGAGPYFSVADADAARKEALAKAKAASSNGGADSTSKGVASSGGASNGAASSGGASSGGASSGADADASSHAEPAVHARLDLFFFFNKEGMEPTPGSADGEEYLEWVALAAEGHKRFRSTAPPPKVAQTLSLMGGHFRTGSAVLLPEGSASTHSASTRPASTRPASPQDSTDPTSLGALAMALRFNEERPGHSILIAGHTDSVGGDKDNDQLSEQRAELVHATLLGERDTFVDLAHHTGTVSDWKQIFKWAAATFPSVEELVSDDEAHHERSESRSAPPGATSDRRSARGVGGEEEEFTSDDEGRGERAPKNTRDSNAASSGSSTGGSSNEPEEGKMGTGFSGCDPGEIDDDASTGKEAAKAFQTAYNENYKLLGGAATIKVDGIVGKQTWGAIFDLYQYNIAQELGEDFDGVQSLRDLMTFLPTKKPYVGFGEHFPADGNFKDDTESEANRRVETFFFQEGQEPNVGILDTAPELTEIYDGGEFVLEEIEMTTARRIRYAIQVLGYDLGPSRKVSCNIKFGDETRVATSNANGIAVFGSPSELDECEITWVLGETTVSRKVHFIHGLDEKYANLGYEQLDENEDSRRETFRREFGLSEDSSDDELDAMLTEWHDTGKKPNAEGNA